MAWVHWYYWSLHTVHVCVSVCVYVYEPHMSWDIHLCVYEYECVRVCSKIWSHSENCSPSMCFNMFKYALNICMYMYIVHVGATCMILFWPILVVAHFSTYELFRLPSDSTPHTLYTCRTQFFLYPLLTVYYV